MKTFADRLQSLIDDELTFPNNEEAVLDNVASALETKLKKMREHQAESKKRVLE